MTQVVSRSQERAYKLSLEGNVLPHAFAALVEELGRRQLAQHELATAGGGDGGDDGGDDGSGAGTELDVEGGSGLPVLSGRIVLDPESRGIRTPPLLAGDGAGSRASDPTTTTTTRTPWDGASTITSFSYGPGGFVFGG
jgi:hypothetical protein